jgi:hypothetical protein
VIAARYIFIIKEYMFTGKCWKMKEKKNKRRQREGRSVGEREDRRLEVSVLFWVWPPLLSISGSYLSFLYVNMHYS